MHPENFETEITAIIKTFNRIDCLKKLVHSIREYYPEMEIIIVNDGDMDNPVQFDDHNIKVINTDFDIGLSAGRNVGLNLVKTKYFLLLDDDFYFTKKTDIGRLYEILESTDFTVAGGAVVDHGYKVLRQNGSLSIDEGVLYLDCNVNTHLQGYPVYDAIRNFFLAETDVIRAVQWDENLKLAEHMDFFLRLKTHNVLVTYDQSVMVNHYPKKTADYAAYRQRSKYFSELMFQKHNITQKIILYKKRTLYKRIHDKLWEYVHMVKIYILGKY